MDIIIGLASNKILWLIAIFFLGVKFKQKRTAYLKLLYLLIEGIEVIDQDIKDIISGKKEAQICKIKQWIKVRIENGEGKILDGFLSHKGLLKKNEKKD